MLKYCLVCLMCAGAAYADAPVAQVIAVVDLDQLMHDSDAAKQQQIELDKQRVAFQEELGVHETALRAEEQALVESQKTLTPEALEAKKKEFEKHVAEVQQKVAVRRDALDATYYEARQKLQLAVMKLIAAEADAQKYTMILPKAVVVFRRDGMEITDTIMKKLNAALPRLVLDQKK